MKRGEIWTVAGGNDYAGKPRPAVVVQDDRFDTGDSITICPLTTDQASGPFVRLDVAPSAANGLRIASRLMVDRLATLPKTRLGRRIGRLDDGTMLRLNRAITVFLGIAG